MTVSAKVVSLVRIFPSASATILARIGMTYVLGGVAPRAVGQNTVDVDVQEGTLVLKVGSTTHEPGVQGSDGLTAESDTLTPLGKLAGSTSNTTGLGAAPKVSPAVTPGKLAAIDPPDETSPSDGAKVTAKLKFVYEM